ncbi:hypothetical protein BKA70DRAFT_1302431 [Coprinopsis sp. MPI-PUGE-AT-0042]|nr:hypothetical protein BKA70DRAFT_1302431 [Coprinopsis sp. MPI-PUGE-AT-0042]
MYPILALSPVSRIRRWHALWMPLWPTTPAVTACWSKASRGMAMAMIAIGSSLGGTIMPILSKSPLPRLACVHGRFGCIDSGSLGSSNLGVDPHGMFQESYPSVNLSKLRHSRSTACCGSSPLSAFTPASIFLFRFSYGATRIGNLANLSFCFVDIIANAISLFGGYAAGPRVHLRLCWSTSTASAGILTYAWSYTQTKELLIALAVLSGFASGVHISLLTDAIFKFSNTDDVGRRL